MESGSHHWPSTAIAAGGGAALSSGASVTSATSQDAQDERRKQIRQIMQDPNMTPQEKSRHVQNLMNGRRRSSVGTTLSVQSQSSTTGHSEQPHMLAAVTANQSASDYASSMARAAAAAAEYYSSDDSSSDDDGDTEMQLADLVHTPDGVHAFEHSVNHADAADTEADAVSYGYDRDITNRSHASGTSSVTTHDTANVMFRPGTYRQTHGRSYSLQDWRNEDTKAAAAMQSSTMLFGNNNNLHPAQISRLMEQSRPVCEHYERNCTIVSPCCGLAFGCRICHDECPVLPPPLAFQKSKDDLHKKLRGIGAAKQKMERRRSMPLDLEEGEETHHAIDRFAIREIICRHCYMRQSSKTNTCINCSIQFAEYHCIICNLWMAQAESPYHCADCGFCRVGGRENFTHCDDCGMCIDAQLFDDHNCKQGKYMSNCPVCQEDLFSSRYASHEMPCGHAIHWHCFQELTSYDSRCPVCKKTAEPPEQMASTWSAIAMGIALQPVPPDMARMVTIMCNDCEMRDENRRWHFLGVRCMNCLSFNTVVEQTILHGREASEFLEQIDAMHQNADGVPGNISMPTMARPTSHDGASTAMDEDVPGGHDTSSGSTDLSRGFGF